MDKLAVSVPEAARLLSLGKNAMYALARSEGFPSVKVGGRIIIPLHALNEWVEDEAKKRREDIRYENVL